ncbi:MAG: tryptophan synthase subunit beta [Candidatus Bipolaricaulia bacterium]
MKSGTKVENHRGRSPEKLSTLPETGWFGEYGGRFYPEALMPALEGLEEAYTALQDDDAFRLELRRYWEEYEGRPSPLYKASNLSEYAGGAKIYLKREDLIHGGGHSLNNALGQILLAKRMGKRRVIAETGSGRHGIAVAMAGALLEVEVEIFMGAMDFDARRAEIDEMEMIGVRVHRVSDGRGGLTGAINTTLRVWMQDLETTYYLPSTAVGPHPYPMIVRNFQSVIGDEIKGQILRKEGRLPDLLVVCVGGGGSAIGTFYPFVDDEAVRFLGVEGGGQGLESGRHASKLVAGSVGVLYGVKTYLLQDDSGRVVPPRSLAADLTYPTVSPELSFYKEIGRAEYISVTDEQAMEGFRSLAQLEGILPALESAHAIYAGLERARQMERDQVVVLTVSGRGERDIGLLKMKTAGLGP